MSVLNKISSQEHFSEKDMKTLWSDQLTEVSTIEDLTTEERFKIMEEIRKEQEIVNEGKLSRAKNFATVGGLVVAATIVWRENSNVIASKALGAVTGILK